MTINKEIKNRIDNLEVGNEIFWKGVTYKITNIEDGIFELTSTNDKSRFHNFDNGDLFTIFYGEYIDSEQDRGIQENK